jgi:hypothetical protein
MDADDCIRCCNIRLYVVVFWRKKSHLILFWKAYRPKYERFWLTKWRLLTVMLSRDLVLSAISQFCGINLWGGGGARRPAVTYKQMNEANVSHSHIWTVFIVKCATSFGLSVSRHQARVRNEWENLRVIHVAHRAVNTAQNCLWFMAVCGLFCLLMY